MPYIYPTVEQMLKNCLCFSRDLNFITLLTVKSSIQTQFTPLRKPLRTKLLITMSKILLASVSNDVFLFFSSHKLKSNVLMRYSS